MTIPLYASVPLFVNGRNGVTDIQAIDLQKPRPFLASCFLNMIVPQGIFDADNAIGIEISRVDSKHYSWIYGGPWGPKGVMKNLGYGAVGGFGQYIEFRLRAIFAEDIVAAGTGVVLYE